MYGTDAEGFCARGLGVGVAPNERAEAGSCYNAAARPRPARALLALCCALLAAAMHSTWWPE